VGHLNSAYPFAHLATSTVILVLDPEIPEWICCSGTIIGTDSLIATLAIPSF
jgi:hypothetical protein